MLINILYGLPTMVICLLLQALLIALAIRYYLHRKTLVQNDSSWSTMYVMGGVMMLLVIGNVAQVGVWALLFRTLGEFPDFESAFYHSAVNFSTLGYGDIVMSDKHKLLGPLEAINGVLMIGVSTAVLMSGFQQAMKKSFSKSDAETS